MSACPGPWTIRRSPIRGFPCAHPLWLLALAVSGSRSERVIGMGMGEYRLVITSAIYLFAILAIVSYLTTTPVSRGYLLLGFPLGTAALLTTRFLWRQRLRAARRSGRVSPVRSSSAMTRRTRGSRANSTGCRRQATGSSPSAAPASAPSSRAAARPCLSSDPSMTWRRLLAMTDADTVIVASDAALAVQKVREISWRLEAGRQHLIMVPSLTDIGGPRMHTRPVAGLPLVHVETPRYTGAQRIVKRTFDVVGSAALLLVLAPTFLILAMRGEGSPAAGPSSTARSGSVRTGVRSS